MELTWVLTWTFSTPSCAKWSTRRRRFLSCRYCSICWGSTPKRPSLTSSGTRPRPWSIGQLWWNQRKSWPVYYAARPTPNPWRNSSKRTREPRRPGVSAIATATSRAVVASHANSRSTWPCHRPVMEAGLPLDSCRRIMQCRRHHHRRLLLRHLQVNLALSRVWETPWSSNPNLVLFHSTI